MFDVSEAHTRWTPTLELSRTESAAKNNVCPRSPLNFQKSTSDVPLIEPRSRLPTVKGTALAKKSSFSVSVIVVGETGKGAS